MKLVKIFGGLLALSLLTSSCDSSSDAELPSDVASILNQNCQSCHGNPPADAPMPLVTCNDILAASPTNSSITVLQAVQNRINSTDDSLVMPPGNQLAAGPLATLNDWLDQGAPPCE
jgi:uncharacterized membrane protein